MTMMGTTETPTQRLAPINPPKVWFTDPGLTAATPITVTAEGRVFGHIASWSACHTESSALGEVCVRAPRSRTGYAGFHLGSLATAEGDDVAVGHIVAGAPHADPVWGLDSSLVHYSHSGWVGADVRAGEDRFGIWISGALRPDISPAQLRALKSSPLSGDWRTDPNTHQLELVACLAVNAPGFKVPRPQALIASTGMVTSIFAVGTVGADDGRGRRLALKARVLALQVDAVRRGGGLPVPPRKPRPAPRRTIAELAVTVEGFREAALVASMSAAAASVQPWEGTIGAENELTGDGRLIQYGALSWARFPLPLRWAAADVGGHDGATIVGRIDSISRTANGQIVARGVIDLGNPDGQEVARLIAAGMLSGISMDLDSVDGGNATVSVQTATGSAAKPVSVTSEARVRAATLVAIPAFDGARISLVGEPTNAPQALTSDSAASTDDADCGCADDPEPTQK
jgi:hypothetical protein